MNEENMNAYQRLAQMPQLRAYKGNLWEEQIHFAYREIFPNRTLMYGLPLQVTAETPNTEGMAKMPVLSLNPQAAQVLMDDLWQCGLRPTEGKGSAGQLAATEAHLKDMQTISFKFIEKAKL